MNKRTVLILFLLPILLSAVYLLFRAFSSTTDDPQGSPPASGIEQTPAGGNNLPVGLNGSDERDGRTSLLGSPTSTENSVVDHTAITPEEASDIKQKGGTEPSRAFDEKTSEKRWILPNVEERSDIRRKWNSFNAKYGNRWRASWSEETGFLTAIEGWATDSSSEAPATIVLEFLRGAAELFGINSGELVEPHVVNDPGHGLTYVSFHQAHRGVLVDESRFEAVVTSEGRITRVTTSLLPRLSLSIVPQIPVQEAIATSARILSLPADTLPLAEPSPLIRMGELQPILTWRVQMESPSYRQEDKSSRWAVYIDAHTGRLVDKSEISFGSSEGGN